jgi:hypothetical protein
MDSFLWFASNRRGAWSNVTHDQSHRYPIAFKQRTDPVNTYRYREMIENAMLFKFSAYARETKLLFNPFYSRASRSQWPHGLRGRSAAA